MKVNRIVPVLFTVSTFMFGSGYLYAFQEGWEAAPLGTYVPTTGDSLPRLIPADEGDWLIGDTVATLYPDCGTTPHKAEVIANSGGHFLRLISGNSNSSCCR